MKTKNSSPKTNKEILKVICRFMANSRVEYKEKRKLWNILTALRGPDFDDPAGEIKLATTAVLRRHIFKNSQPLCFMADMCSDSWYSLTIRKREIPSSHFNSHIQDAFSAAGLKWKEVNLQ